MNARKIFVTMTLAAFVLVAALPVLAADYSIDTSHSSVTFQIKHLAISKVKGAFTDFTGSFSYDPAKPEASSAVVVIQMASVDTGNEKRDDHLRNADFFEVDTYPNMTFKSTSVKMKNDEEGQVSGNLTMHGVTKPVTLDLEINGMITDPWGNERVGASLSGKIDRKDWGLTWSKAMETGGLVVADEVKISIELEGIKAK